MTRLIFRTSSAHEEGGTRVYAVQTTELRGEEGRVRSLHGHRVDDKTPFELKADLVLLAMGFVNPVATVLEAFGVEKDARGNAKAGTEAWIDTQGGAAMPAPTVTVIRG